MKQIKSIILLVGLMTLIVVAWGSDVGTLNLFSSGTVISSTAVNANFDDIKTAVNSKQDRVTGTCTTGNAIRVVNAAGTVTCEAIPPGDITGVTASTGLSGGGTSGTVTVSADTNYLQRRVSGTCAAGFAMREVSSTGSVTCEPIPESSFATGCGSTCTGMPTGSTAVRNVRSITVAANGAGRIVVFLTGWMDCFPTTSNPEVYWVGGIMTSSTAVPGAFTDGNILMRMDLSTAGDQAIPIMMAKGYAVSSSGNYNYYANFKNFTTSAATCNIKIASMEGIYTP